MEIKVGEIVRAKREEQKISLGEFAKELGISSGYLSQIENGRKTNPSSEIIYKIADLLDIDLAMLLGIDTNEENYLVQIPSLLKLTLAKDRYSKALEEQQVLRKYCALTERILDTKYLLDDPDLYIMLLNDLLVYVESSSKRYMSIKKHVDDKLPNCGDIAVQYKENISGMKLRDV